jgi:transposase
MKPQLTDSVRAQICSKYDDGQSIIAIANLLELKYATVSSVVKLYEGSGRISAMKTRRSRLPKLTAGDRELIFSDVADDCSVTLERLRERLASERGVRVSTATIFRMLREFHYSVKQVTLVPLARNTPQNLRLTRDYAIEFGELDESRLFFLDEMGVQFTMRHKYGRSIVGTPARKIVTAIRSKNFSVSAIMSRNGLYHFEIQNRPYNSENYGWFLMELFRKFENDGIRNAILIMDNCPIHKTASLRTLIQAQGHSVRFLPPYSPSLNPIEELFSKWKNSIKTRNCNSQEELLHYVNVCSRGITTTDCSNFYNHMRECVSAVLSEQSPLLDLEPYILI